MKKKNAEAKKKEKRLAILILVLCLVLIPLLIWAVYHFNWLDTPEQPVAAETTVADHFASEEAETTEPVSVLTLTAPKETSLSVDQPTFTIEGKSNPLLPLTVNKETVTMGEDGSFSFLCKLVEGENKIVVTDGIQTVELKVTYTPKLILSVSPTKTITSNGNEELRVSAKVEQGVSVTVTLAGQTVTLKEKEKKEDSVLLSASLKLPAQTYKKQNLGRIQFKATRDKQTKTVKGASVIIAAKPKPPIPIDVGKGTVKPPEMEGGTVKVLSPKKDYGRGEAQIVEATAAYAETTLASFGSDHSSPLATPFLRGTYDYVVGSKTYNNKQYYVTRSGYIVEKADTKSYEGYVLPTNTITAQSGGTSELVLTMNWKVPFHAELRPQKYKKGYQGRTFNVSSFTAEFIDFTFQYTNAATGTLTFSKSPMISSAKWISQGAKDGTSTLRVYLRQKGTFYGYHAYYTSDNRLHISFRHPHGLSDSPKVLLDIGHGGRDCGAIGANGVYESKVNYQIGMMLKDKLQKRGIRVELVRSKDSYYSLPVRQQAARDSNADLMLSLHSNSNTNTSLSGTEVYYYTAFSKSAASKIHKQLAGAWKEIYRGNAAMANRVVPADGGVRFYPFKVTRVEECPALLVETGYLSNPTECAALCDPRNQDKLAEAIADGVADYFRGV